ncbi:MAG: hypothetical protein IT384_07205 [Deltaproteobacteria bacterium]|nr:hypothetical protein [Deltaproteobacteria bacterium]
MTRPQAEDCPTFEALSRAFSEGELAPLGDHLDTCTACAAVCRDLERMKEAGQALPWSAPSAERAAELESRLLLAVQAAPRTERGFALGIAVGAIAASVAIFSVMWLSPEQRSESSAPVLAAAEPAQPLPSAAVQLHASTGARFERVTEALERGGRREVVRIEDGTLDLQVGELRAEDRFVVLTPDGEVEVRGAEVRVEVRLGRLGFVEVISGRAEVRPPKGPPSTVAPGERWVPPVEAAQVAPARTAVAELAPDAPRASTPVVNAPAPPAPRVVAPPAPHVVAPPRALETSPAEGPSAASGVGTEDLFAAAWKRLRAGDASGAADDFDAMLAKGPSSPLAEDARYWLAVSRAKAHRVDAEAAMLDFLDRHPDSRRGGEVALMLGWRLLDRGALDQAEPRFQAALGDPALRIREGAARGLQALSALRRR